MASTAAQGKRIFAPGADPSGAPSQAAQYTRGQLSRESLLASPLAQYHTWFRTAVDTGVLLPEAVCLSTAALPSGRVSSRMVYLKELDGRGFVVYSNWGTSRKAADVASNARASLCFWWREAERQVRVEGPVERLSSAESQTYFDTRARGSRVGAWASAQSTALAEREQLEGRVHDVERRFDGQDHIPVPEFWGGLRVLPESVEFWQGRDSRLHDRFLYTRVRGEPGDEEGPGADAKADDVTSAEATWKIERLSP